MILVRSLSTAIKEGFRIIKTKWAENITSTAKQSNPFGFDSNVPKEIVAVFADTSSKEEPVIVGYLYASALSDLNTGDSAMYSTDSEGKIKSTVKLRNDGTAEILGTGDYMVRFNELEKEYNKTKAVLDSIISVLTPPINEPGNGAPSAFQAAMNVAVGAKTTGDISGAKIEELKTIS